MSICKYCIVLYCIVLYCIVLYCILSYRIGVLYCNVMCTVGRGETLGTRLVISVSIQVSTNATAS